MKKYLFTPFFTCLFLISKGQKFPTELGFQTGVNLNSAYGNAVNKDNKDMLIGLSVGGYIKINLRKSLG